MFLVMITKGTKLSTWEIVCVILRGRWTLSRCLPPHGIDQYRASEHWGETNCPVCGYNHSLHTGFKYSIKQKNTCFFRWCAFTCLPWYHTGIESGGCCFRQCVLASCTVAHLKTFYATLFLFVPFPRGMVVPVTQACSPPGEVFGTVGGKEWGVFDFVPAAAIPEGHPKWAATQVCVAFFVWGARHAE